MESSLKPGNMTSMSLNDPSSHPARDTGVPCCRYSREWVTPIWSRREVVFAFGETRVVLLELRCSEAPAGWAIEGHKNHGLIYVRVCVCSCVRAKSPQSCLTLCDPLGCSPPGSSIHGDSPVKYWSGLPLPPRGDLPDPGMELTSLTSPARQAGSLPLVPPGKHICICKHI